MGRQAPSDEIAWLVRQGAGDALLPVSNRMSADDSHWRATIDRIEVGPGIRVHLTRAMVHRPLTVEAAQRDPGIWLLAQMSLRGRLAIRFADGAGVDIGPENAAFFRPVDRSASLTPAPGRSLRLVGYMVRDDRLLSMFGDAIPAVLKPLLAADPAASAIVPVPCDTTLRRLAATLFTNPLRGPMRSLFIEGIVLQFLALQAASATKGASASLSREEAARLHLARDRLLADMRNPPSAADLAGEGGLSEAALNQGFRRLFGGTVYEVLRDHRLDHARIALETTDIPVKQIAHGVGYNHVTNFINAFTRRYGAPPRRYARGQDGASAANGSGDRVSGG